MYVVIYALRFKLLRDMLSEVKSYDPAIADIFIPLFIIRVACAVIVEYILSDKQELLNALSNHHVNDFPFEEHDVIINRIIPFADKFDDCEALFVVDIQNLQIEGLRAEIVPLRVEQKVIDLFVKFKFAIYRSIKG